VADPEAALVEPVKMEMGKRGWRGANDLDVSTCVAYLEGPWGERCQEAVDRATSRGAVVLD
jgi:hypothetical protein